MRVLLPPEEKVDESEFREKMVIETAERGNKLVSKQYSIIVVFLERDKERFQLQRHGRGGKLKVPSLMFPKTGHLVFMNANASFNSIFPGKVGGRG